MTYWLIVGISGVTCGGKTTLAQQLVKHFTENKVLTDNITINQVKMINQDDYFLAVDNAQHTWIERLNHINWEIITALDMDRMREDISNVLGCTYRSYNNRKTTFFTDPVTITSLNILILEGFLIFNSHYTLDLCDVKFHLHLPYEKCYQRRQNRVYEPADVIGYFEMCVWPMYEQHFNEFIDRNDVIKLNGDVSEEKIFQYVINRIKSSL